MKKQTTYLFVILGILFCFRGYSQFPSTFVAPKGIVLILDSIGHKGASVTIERIMADGDFKQLVVGNVPRNESEFRSQLEKASADFAGYPAVTDKAFTSWWKGLNEMGSFPLFLMNPAGIMASGMGYYDKDVKPGEVYEYRVIIKNADGSVISDKKTGKTYNSNAGIFPVPHRIRTSEEAKLIRLTWGYATKKIPSLIKIYRLDEGKKDFHEIRFDGGFNTKGDSILITARDTAVESMAMYKYFIRAFDWLENAFPASDTIVTRAYSIYLAPVIRTLYTKPVPEQHAIRLSWPKLKGTGLRGILLFRGATHDGNFQHLATLPATDTAFVDVVPRANENYWYFAVVANRFGYGMPSARTFDLVKASSVPLKPGIPRLKTEINGVRVTWRYGGGMIRGYAVYRGEGYRGELRQLSDFLPASDSMSYLDTTAIPGNAYHYSLVAYGEGSGTSPLSDAVSIMLPPDGKITVPAILHFRNDGERITFFWDNLLLNDGRVEGYMVYRKLSDDAGFVRITKPPLSKLTNSFTDSITFHGKTVEYAVTSVDMNGTESRRSNPVTIVVPASDQRNVNGLSVVNDGGKVVVRWAEMMNRTIAGFMVYRFTDNDEPVMVGKASAGKNSFVDPSPVTGNKLNSYFVRALFIDGTESEPGEIASIRIP